MKNLTTDIVSSITGITCDSRKVKPGYAFVAISGFNDDGHKYIDEAIKNGASVIITEKTFHTNQADLIKVDDSREILGKLASEFYNHPSTKLETIGVTGTNGKTTTTHLIYNLLNINHKQSGLIGTVKVDTGEKIYKGNLTTPSPVLLQKYLKEMVNNHLQYCCMEVSSHGIKLKRVADTSFSIKVGTNITTDHFDLHPDFNDYLQIKKSFLETYNNKTLVLINGDDPYLNDTDNLANNQINYSINGQTVITALNVSYRGITTHFTYSLNETIVKNSKEVKPCSFPIYMLLPGKHNIYNALIAITIGLIYGLSPESIQNFFKSYTGVWRRLEIIYNKEYTIIDDCAHNPGSYRAVFKTIENLPYNNIYIVNSLRGNRGTAINRANAATISQWLTTLNKYHLITSKCEDVVKTDDKVFPREEKAFLDTLNKKNIYYTHFQELKPALQSVIKKVDAGDLVLLLGPHAMDNAGKMVLEMIK